MDHLFRDLRYGLKLLVQEKVFTLTVLATLGLAIGANVTIFGVVDSVLFEPLPYEDADRLAVVFNSYPEAGVPRASSGVPDHLERRREVAAFEEAALYRWGSATLGDQGRPERLLAMNVTPSFFPVLRQDAEIGRVFAEADGEPGQDQVVLLSHGLWQRLFAGDPSAIGRELRLDDVPHEIVGVLPEDFFFLDPDVRLWRPLAFTPEQKSEESRHSNGWNEIARLRPDATFEQARQQIDAITASVIESSPLRQLLVDAGFHTEVHPMREDAVRDVSGTLYLLWGGVGCVFLIACVNLANLVLVRSRARRKELATRCALGAGQGRVTQQLLIESLVLTTIGGAIGLGLGQLGLRALSTLGVDQLPRGAEIQLDASAILLAIGLSLTIGVVLALIPVMHLARVDLQGVLREESRGGTESRSSRLFGRGLVAAQVAFAFVLLIGAGLLLASFRQILAVDPGYDVEPVLTAEVTLPRSRYEDREALTSFVDRALERLRTMPGVEAVGVTDTLPMSAGYSDSVIFPEGYQPTPGESVVSPTRISLAPGTFESLGIEVVRGRDFDARDDFVDEESTALVAIVDESLARFFWGDEDPIGRRMFQPDNPEALTDPGPDPDWITVVGVVEDIRLLGPATENERVGTYYFPIAQRPARGLGFTIRGAAGGALSGSLLASAQAAFAALDPELPVFDARPMRDRLSDSLTPRRSPMLLAVVFGTVALFLASIGLYGVLAYVVAQRRRELGVRLALGSSTGGVFRLVVGEGLWIVGVGLAAGALGAFALRPVLASQLYGVGALDPGVFGGVTALLVAVAFAASALPGYRASRTDPAVVLHE